MLRLGADFDGIWVVAPRVAEASISLQAVTLGRSVAVNGMS